MRAMKPSYLDDLAPVIGYTATRAVSVWYAGRDLYVPVAATYDHPLAKILGLPALRALCTAFPAAVMAIPTDDSERRYRNVRVVAERLAQGATISEIAYSLDCTQRAVYRWRKDAIEWRWLEYAEGRLKNLGTNEVSDEPPGGAEQG